MSVDVRTIEEKYLEENHPEFASWALKTPKTHYVPLTEILKGFRLSLEKEKNG